MYNVREYGAVGDGATVCTRAFTAALGACGSAGGGTVHVPPGHYLSGPLRLPANARLHLDAGARLSFSDDPADYPLIDSYWEGVQRKTHMPQLFSEGTAGVSLDGHGVVDGCGANWWARFKSGVLQHPRPRLLVFQDCRDIRVEGLTFENAPAWTVHPVRCENVRIQGVTVRNPRQAPNTDGINPDSSRNVHIAGCHLDVGDDCITIKSGTERLAERRPCENITVTGCTLVHGHGGVVIGSEMSGDVRNVVIADCVFDGTDRGIRIKTRRGRGGVVEAIRVSNLVMRRVHCPLVMNMFYYCGVTEAEEHLLDPAAREVEDGTPVIRDIAVSHVTATEVRSAAAFLHGLPEMPIEGLVLDDIRVRMASEGGGARPAMIRGLPEMHRRGIMIRHVVDMQMDRVQVLGQEGPWIDAE